MKATKSWTKIARDLLKYDPEITKDILHQKLCGIASLYTKAYFHHKATIRDKALIRYLWKVSNKVMDEK